jgi:MinD-like ATPase involved in chromosome partitioning or flagellar assembly
MTVIAVCSTKHSPGATTLALALVTAWTSTRSPAESPVLVEADPSGGDLAARLGLPSDPGMVSLAAAARHPESRLDVLAHSQHLPCGGTVVLGPTNPNEAEAAVVTVASRLPGELNNGGHAAIDCGRWARGSAASAALHAADLTLVVAHPDLPGIAHVQERLDALRAASGGRLGVVLVGDRPYGVQNVKNAIGVPLVMAIGVDRDGTRALLGEVSARSAWRSQLVRSARSVLDAVEAGTRSRAMA